MTGPAPNETLIDYLRDLHTQAGCPSYRVTGAATGTSYGWVSDVINGKIRRARWSRMLTLVTYLGGDESRAFTLWKQQAGVGGPVLKAKPGDLSLPRAVSETPVHEMAGADLRGRIITNVEKTAGLQPDDFLARAFSEAVRMAAGAVLRQAVAELAELGDRKLDTSADDYGRGWQDAYGQVCKDLEFWAGAVENQGESTSGEVG